MEAAVFSTGAGHFGYQVGAGDKVAQFAELFGENGAVVEVFSLSEDEVESVESSL